MEATHDESAERTRSLLVGHRVSPTLFRTLLTRVPPDQRDAWLDSVLGLDPLLLDDPALPRGCVPYLPCSVDKLLRVVEQAGVGPCDVFVDVGAGPGRPAALVHLLTGASVIGIEVQPSLVLAALELMTRIKLARVVSVLGDATRMTGSIAIGSVFFFYCPFSGRRLQKVIDDLEGIAATKEIRVCCVDVSFPPRPWLATVSSSPDLTVHRSTLLDHQTTPPTLPTR